MPAPVTPDDTRLLAALANGSRALIDAHFWGEGVDRLLGELGRASGVSRVWVFQLIELKPNVVVQDYVFEWAAAPRYRQLMQKCFRFFSMIFDDPVYRRMVEERERGEPQRFITQALDEGPLRRNLESQAILSMVTVPIMVDGRWWGTLGFDDCERALDWQGAGMHALSVAAELIASAIYRQQLTSRKRQVELFQRVADCGIWEIDPRSGATWCSNALLRTLGYPDGYARLPLRRLLAHIPAADRRQLWARLRESLRTGQTSWRLDVRLKTAHGERCWYEIVAEGVLGERGDLESQAGLIIDISQRKQGEESAIVAAEYDELTGVMNRRGLTRHLSQALANGTPPHHLLLLDIDHFKPVNDHYGHPAGDALLRQLAQRLTNELRSQDGLFRLGGEEFAVLISGLDARQVLQVAERLRRGIAGVPFPLDGTPARTRSVQIGISISIGVAALPEGQTLRHTQSMAIAQADQALYAAKHAGRNRVASYWQPGDAGDAPATAAADVLAGSVSARESD